MIDRAENGIQEGDKLPSPEGRYLELARHHRIIESTNISGKQVLNTIRDNASIPRGWAVYTPNVGVGEYVSNPDGTRPVTAVRHIHKENLSNHQSTVAIIHSPYDNNPANKFYIVESEYN